MSFLDKIFKSKTNNAIGIDIGSSSIKVVELKRDGDKAVLGTYGELSLGPYGGVSIGQSTNLPTEKLIEAVTDLLKEKEVAITTLKAGIAIPFKASLLSVIEMPELSKSELDSMVPIEARKYIPVPIADVTIDWSVIPKKENEDEPSNAVSKKTMEILLVAIHNNILNQYNEIVEKTGLEAKFSEIEVFSSMRSVVESTSGPIMILDMGASTTKLYIIDRGIVLYSHTVNHGSQEITGNIARSLNISVEDAEIQKRAGDVSRTIGGADIKEAVSNVIDRIFSETNRFLFEYQKKHNRNIKSVTLIGGGSALKGFKKLAEDNFKVEIISGNPFEKIVVPAFLEDVLRQTGPEFAVSAGVALRALTELE